MFCYRKTLQYFRHLLVFMFAIEEINKDPTLLPNVTLGYHIFDSCNFPPKSLSGLLDMISGMNHSVPNYGCWGNRKLLGVVGDVSTLTSHWIAQLLGVFRYPQISYGTADPLFNDRIQFPSFYRTVPNEFLEADAIVQILKHFGWKWVGLVLSKDESGERALVNIKEGMKSYGGCVAFTTFLRVTDTHDVEWGWETIAKKIIKKGVNVIVLFLNPIHIELLPKMLNKHKMEKKIWVTSTFFSSINNVGIKTFNYLLNGTISLSVQGGVIPAFKQFFYRLTPTSNSNDVFTEYIWEWLYGCSFSRPVNNRGRCTGNETVDKKVLTTFGTFELTISYQVYTAVYALAHALHNMYTARAPANNKGLAKGWKIQFKPWQIPQSLCNEPCAPGYRVSERKGESPCCYDCVQCPDGEISNITDAPSCLKCPEYEKSDGKRTVCIPKTINYLSFEDPLGTCLVSFAVMLLITTCAVLGIFVKHWDTPMVKANNQNLSCLLLISLMLCFLCTFLFIGHPTRFCCLLRQVTFGVVFTISISSILAKTLTVIIVFNATKPGSKMKKYLGSKLSIMLVMVSSLGTTVISILWTTFYPPFPEADTSSTYNTIILLCNEGSITFFFCIIGYMGTLSVLSFFVAFLAKDFPDRFNEAKNITFSMLVFCSVWVSFVPAYLSSKGSKMVAVELFAILSSSAGLLGCIFFPKCFIIFFRPELNRKQSAVKTL
ncbi:hypothetical protein GDO86_010647 [Hymenochirus boettgeri]|uniref:G-protein coupled receptors family 3 profile domain-containing protein n=1 Tax=Hymenochirus boettgeri TaxID=247094 RepID=A0A8T2JKY8_9PIPI|nr:hypothetical protein GDO86_010647 [Hymenochirus boettgeri]